MQEVSTRSLDHQTLLGAASPPRPGRRSLDLCRRGELHQLGRVRAEEIEAPHERSGPVGPNARSSPVREQRAARRRNQQQALVSDVAAAVADLAGERGWTRLLVSGGDRLTEALPAELRGAVLEERRALASLPHSELRSHA